VRATLKELAQIAQADIQGDPEYVIYGIAGLDKAQAGDICFLATSKFKQFLSASQAGVVILKPEDADEWSGNALLCQNPLVAYAKIANFLSQQLNKPTGIHSTAFVDESAEIDATAYISAMAVIEAQVKIAAGCFIGPGCVVSNGASIATNTYLHANVTIYPYCVVGQNVIIHSGTVIGSDGFGNANDNGVWIKIPQLGRVIIGDDVEIGANTAIDCGAMEDTIIGNGVKIDNLVHIAHNVQIGDHCAIAGCVGIAGSTTLGKHCSIGGVSGVADHIEIGDNIHFTGMAMVTRSISEPGLYSSGIPAESNRQWRRNVVRFRQLDVLEKRIKALESKLKQLEGS